MSENANKHSRTERATPQKRKKAREKGQIFRSKEVSGALGFIATATGVWWLGARVERGLVTTMSYLFSHSADLSSPVSELTALALSRASSIGLPFMALAFCFSVGGTLAQSLPVVTFEKFKPDVKRLFSISKITQMVSLSGLANLARGVLGLSALTISGFSVLIPELSTVSTLPTMGVPALGAWVAGLILRMLFRACVIFALIAVLDYVLNHRQHEDQLKMTKQEVKEEHKQLEGDPQIKARVRRLQRIAARKRMMSMVDEATVVITNPTHVSVALIYDAEISPAPKVVAKGKGDIAKRIRDRARQNGIVIYEDPPLARALYTVDLGSVIPAELYKAVAEVLAHLVRVRALQV